MSVVQDAEVMNLKKLRSADFATGRFWGNSTTVNIISALLIRQWMAGGTYYRGILGCWQSRKDALQAVSDWLEEREGWKMNIYKAIIGVMGDIGISEKKNKNNKDSCTVALMMSWMPATATGKTWDAYSSEYYKAYKKGRVSSKGMHKSISSVKSVHVLPGDGSSIKCVVISEGMDSGDKATNKAMAIAWNIPSILHPLKKWKMQMPKCMTCETKEEQLKILNAPADAEKEVDSIKTS